MTCKHEKIKTWRTSDTGELVGLWSCEQCLKKFSPVDLERDKAAKRYETVRKMSLRAFGEAYHENLSSGKPFDEIIDDLRGVYFPNAVAQRAA